MYPPTIPLILFGLLSHSPAGSSDGLRQELLALVNQERALVGAAPLRRVEPLDQVAQESAKDIHEQGAVTYDERSIALFQRRLRQAGYQAHGWHQAFAAGPEDAPALLEWIRKQYPETFQSLLDPDYQEAGIGISDLSGTPLYTFFFAWRESESFARQTAGLSDPAKVRGEMLTRVNTERTAAGLPPLESDLRLDSAAQAHAEDMLLRSYYNHLSPEGVSPGARVRKAGYAAQRVGENIARGPVTVAEALDNWMASQEHRRNLLHPGFTHLGIGVAVGKSSIGYTVLWVQDFASPLP